MTVGIAAAANSCARFIGRLQEARGHGTQPQRPLESRGKKKKKKTKKKKKKKKKKSPPKKTKKCSTSSSAGASVRARPPARHEKLRARTCGVPGREIARRRH